MRMFYWMSTKPWWFLFPPPFSDLNDWERAKNLMVWRTSQSLVLGSTISQTRFNCGSWFPLMFACVRLLFASQIHRPFSWLLVFFCCSLTALIARGISLSLFLYLDADIVCLLVIICWIPNLYASRVCVTWVSVNFLILSDLTQIWTIFSSVSSREELGGLLG